MKRIVWLMIFIFTPVLAGYAAVDTESIVGIWMFDEGSGDIAADSSGNGHDGQIQIAEWTDGKFGTALLFPRDGEVSIESTEKLQLGNQLTIMAYFTAEALDDWHQLIAKNNEYLLRIDPPAEGGNMSSFVNLDGGWEPRASAFVPEQNRWTHFAAVYNSDDSKLRVYVDGVLSGESDRVGNPGPGDDPVTVGHWGGGSRFVGAIDEVAIFNAALEEADILSIATNGLKTVLSIGASVQPSGKLAATWGELKVR